MASAIFLRLRLGLDIYMARMKSFKVEGVVGCLWVSAVSLVTDIHEYHVEACFNEGNIP